MNTCYFKFIVRRFTNTLGNSSYSVQNLQNMNEKHFVQNLNTVQKIIGKDSKVIFCNVARKTDL